MGRLSRSVALTLLVSTSAASAAAELLLVKELAAGQAATVDAGTPVVFDITVYNLSLSQQLIETLVDTLDPCFDPLASCAQVDCCGGLLCGPCTPTAQGFEMDFQLAPHGGAGDTIRFQVTATAGSVAGTCTNTAETLGVVQSDAASVEINGSSNPCNLATPVCSVPCRGGCALPVPVRHATLDPVTGGSFNLRGTAYESTCWCDGTGSVPPIRFWAHDAYADANHGCVDPDTVTPPWLANCAPSGLDAATCTTSQPPGRWILAEANWLHPGVDGCVTSTPSGRTVAEISFVDAGREDTTAHGSYYLLASVPDLGGFDFDQVTGGLGPGGAEVPVAPVDGLTIDGRAEACVGSTAATESAHVPDDARFFLVDVSLDEADPVWYTELGARGAPALVAGQQVLFAAGTVEPTTSDPASRAWRPVFDPARTDLALGVIPRGTRQAQVALPRTDPGTRYWLATRIVYRDSSINPTGPFLPASGGPRVGSALSGHCGPIAPPRLAFSRGRPGSPNAKPGQPVTYHLEVRNTGSAASDGVQVRLDFDPSLDLSGFDPVTFPSQVTATPELIVRPVSWDVGLKRLIVEYTTPLQPGELRVLDITGFNALRGPGDPPKRRLGNTCSVMSITHQNNSDSLNVPICVDIGCSGFLGFPAPVERLLATKRGDDVELRWSPSSGAETSGYNVWKVVTGDRTLIPDANRAVATGTNALVLACSGVLQSATPSCVDEGAVATKDELYFYQVRGTCSDGTEGAAHP